jgi:hypothetical protein
MGTCELCTDCGQGKVARSCSRRFGRIGTGGFCPLCRQLATDVRARPVAGAQLLHNDRVHVAGAAQVGLAGTQVDSRLLATLATLAALCPLDIISFGRPEPGASARVALDSAEVAAATPWANVTQRLSQVCPSFSAPQRPPYLPAFLEALRIKPRRTGLRIEYRVPCPLGLLGTRS